MTELDESLQVQLQHHYSIVTTPNDITLTSHSTGSLITVILGVLLGVISIILGFIIDFKIIILGVLLLCTPFLYTSWKFPQKVFFSQAQQVVVIISRLNTRCEIDFGDILEISVEAEELSSFVNPFENSNKDFAYDFFLKEKSGEKHRLIRLEFRKEEEEQAIQLAELFNDIINPD